MVELLFLQSFAIALALGALIGLEREYARYKERGHEYAGIRTFPLIALFGALAAYLGEKISLWVFLISLALMGVLIVIAYFIVADRKHIGATSEIAGLLTFFIGVLSYRQEYIFATILAIIITVILYARSMLHSFAERIKPAELSATLKFAVIAFLILPFLPNKWYSLGSWGMELFNPFLTWLMVVFISGISFVGYVLLKWIGEKGIVVTGMLGGLVSSTAVTTSFAERSTKEPRLYQALVLGVILANGIMFIRVLVEVSVINPALLMRLLLPLLSLALVTAVVSFILWKRAKKVQGKIHKIHLGSPFTVKPALKFAVVFALILALVKVAHLFLASKGVYAVSFLSGLTDVDAIVVSLSQLAKNNGIAGEIAQEGIVIAVLTNVAVKGAIAWWLGERKFGRIILGIIGLLIVVGLALVMVV
ncbi:MAG: MgtC/SapB family protein [Nanoarchaeota archaeon]